MDRDWDCWGLGTGRQGPVNWGEMVSLMTGLGGIQECCGQVSGGRLEPCRRGFEDVVSEKDRGRNKLLNSTVFYVLQSIWVCIATF